ncbi:interferon-induced very large GTPase 1-like [Neoarius graeffei]|uniref:interferon-induced very large GTPase 1-like n=1 Tax=Neoarius graeffei TaxID=443677 RepID=UPI00298D1D92|nr:interferon-induced very large GTPase 1-like [Neoarius graeffei]
MLQMSHQAKLRIILQDHDIRKLDLPHGIPGTVGELQSIVRETFGLDGSFTLHYKDADFGEEYFSLTSTSDIKDKDTIKVIHIVEPPSITLNLTDLDSSNESTSETSIHSSSALAHTSVTSIHPSISSCSSGSQDTLILSSPEHVTQRSQCWPTEFPVPRFAYDTELVLASGDEDFKKDGIQLNFTTILPDILEKLAESILQYVAYPTGAELSDVAKALIQKHPCLKEPGSYNGCCGWQQRLKYKMGNYRSKLRGLGCPELDVNSLKKNQAHEKAPAKNIKKPRKAEVNSLPPHPQGITEGTLEQERVELLNEVKKRNNCQIINDKMAKTFSLRGKEVVSQASPVSDLKDRWHALFNAAQQVEDPRDFFDKELQQDLSEKQSAEPDVEEETDTSEDVPAPYDISVQSIGTDFARLGWKCRENTSTFELRCTSSTSSSIQTLSQNYAEVLGLCPGTEYTFTLVAVSENGIQSSRAEVSAYTIPNPPESIEVKNIGSTSVTLTWQPPASLEKKYHVVCSHNGITVHEEETEINTIVFSNLTPGKNYSFHIATVLKNGSTSKTAELFASTKTNLKSFLQDVGLNQHLTKLSLSAVLQIDKSTVTDDPACSQSDLPWLFLKKIMMVNVTARSVKCAPSADEDEDMSLDLCSDLERLVLNEDSDVKVNPLDIITALFLCSDSFLQQEIALKMSMCQFSVPLLLPNCDTQQSTLMLWALRDIVKKFRPHSLSDPRGFVEERIVLADLPLVSFVRLGDCSISKSQILNKLLSNPQQYHDTFVHRDMDCGDIPRKISNGLVEISWYLPCGSKNIDIFPEPVAIANLRGDISTFVTQYSFLCQISTAVFVFFDNFESNYQLLTNTHVKAQLFLVGNADTKAYKLDLLKRTAAALKLNKRRIILKTKQNDADFVKNLCSAVRDVVKNRPMTVQLEKMTTVAHEFGIWIDEDCKECQNAKENAEAITSKIQDTLKFKKEQLPLQGEIWKKLGKLEKEECRLRKAGDKNIEMYKSELKQQKMELRKQQRSYEMSEAMTCFITALSSSPLERSYFLKWMRMNLDNLSRKKLTCLRELYKEKCQESSEKKEEIALLDRQISNSALGTEHFLREMGQLYEAAVILPENIQARQQMLHLPSLCARLLLDGFPLELVDGDASNIPLRWISDVLTELNNLAQPKNKIMVVTVLGVQSTGKSTLLNTMFGVQFAVSSGRCTRGAFMLLIKITDSFREILNCDHLVIIDTEGLKSPELAQLDDSYEHDNELATLVVGLSDITIINIAMENSTEMKDILQIVVHAFLRMKEVGKKPMCAFVHQNVADVSAHDKNMRDRKLLLKQLNEMTEAAAKMENKEDYKKFTDVMEYDPETGNWYIPGLWHGNPPMAPVNAGYSEAVYDFKKNMMDILVKKKISTNNITEFLEWTKSLWNAVKYENFIFSFRNSLVANAYMKLCAEFHKWEWSFKKHMYKWLMSAETRVSNFEMMKSKSDKTNLQDFLRTLKHEASSELDNWEKTLLENIIKYFEQTEGHVYLVERYKEDFVNSAKSLRKETENSVMSNLEAVIEIRAGKNNLDHIKKTNTDKMEKKVLNLLEELRKNRSLEGMSEEELDNHFEHMWKETLEELSFKGLQKQTISDSVFRQLRENMRQKGSSVSKELSNVNLHEYGNDKFIVHSESFLKKLFFMDNSNNLQKLADSVIDACKQSVSDKKEKKSDYHDTYIQEILHRIDDNLTLGKELKFSDKFELSLKLHICAISAREFQAMHDCFIAENDPRRCLEQFKEKYRADFKDLFSNRDQCQRKAEEFTKLCLSPAVETFICNSLGPDIIDTMLQGENAFQFSTRAFFQYTLLGQLLTESDFQKYLDYIRSYERFVKDWILKQITDRFSRGNKLFKLEEQHLKGAIMEIKEAIKKAQHKTDKNKRIKIFVQNICRELGKKLVISNDALEAVMALSNAKQEQFAHWLMQSVEEMEALLKTKLQNKNIQSKLRTLKIKPQDELFKRVFGCGKLCPFCKAPCEAGGEAHTHHSASVHRPQGLGQYRYEQSETLVTNICSTDVNSDTSFRCLETKHEWHPYKKYREIFPDWHIPADPSIEASDYWKYVMAKFNNQFAEAYNAKPAAIPLVWKKITKQQAENSLKECFSIK